jgi:hypothetical protein
VTAEETYTVIHDIYSLGVVLLELGLWEPLVQVQRNGTQSQYRLHRGFPDLLEEGNLDRGVRAWNAKERLVNIATEWLPPRMGEAYTEVVVACLNVGEGGIVNMPDFDRERPDENALTTAYIKYVVSRLEGLKV